MNGAATMLELDVLRERKRLLDEVWLLSVAIALLAVGVPWFLQWLDINFALVAWVAFGFGCFYVAVSSAADRTASKRVLLALLASLHCAGMITLGVLWHFAGNWHNPALLAIFLLPVSAAAIVFNKWRLLAGMALAISTVVLVTLAASPALQWRLVQSGLPSGPLPSLVKTLPNASVRAFPALTEVPAYMEVLLFVFAILSLGAVLAGESLSSFMDRLHRRLAETSGAQTQSDKLASELMRLAPLPSVLVYADTLRIARASESFARQFFLDQETLEGLHLFQAVKFSYPDAVEALISGQRKDVPLAVCEVNGEKRLIRPLVSRLVHNQYPCALVVLQDAAETHYLRLGINALVDPFVVVDHAGNVALFNSAAKRILETLEPGTAARASLCTSNLPFDWWDLGMRSAYQREVQFHGKPFLARCAEMRLDGERDRSTLIHLQQKESRS